MQENIKVLSLFFLSGLFVVFIFLSIRLFKAVRNKRRAGEALALGDRVKLTFALFFLIGIAGELLEAAFAGAREIIRVSKVAAFVAATFVIYKL